MMCQAGVHPSVAGKDLTRLQFDLVWHHTVDLLQRGFQTGSILTVDKDEAKALGKPNLRRYIYNMVRKGFGGSRGGQEGIQRGVHEGVMRGS
jgi:hypothetical protein